MESIKRFFDVLDYGTYRAFMYVLTVVAWALIRRHGKRT